MHIAKRIVFGEWRSVRRVSKRGHTGEVFQVENVNDPTKIAALKRFLPSCPGGIRRFRAEEAFLIARKVPAIMPRHLGSGTDEDGNPYYVMEWVEVLGRKLPHELLLEVMKEIISACIALRVAGYYHCDLKPPNVGFLNGHLVLIDYGCVLPIDDALRQPIKAGTDKYQAPEVARGMISELSEIYSLGRITAKLARFSSLYRLARAVLAATEKNHELRPKSFEAYSALLTISDSGFIHLIHLYTRLQLWRMVIIALGTVLFSTLTVGTTLAIMASRKQSITAQVLANHGKEITTLSEKRLGRYYLDVGNRTEAVRHFRNAADLGDEQARKILALLKKVDGETGGN